MLFFVEDVLEFPIKGLPFNAVRIIVVVSHPIAAPFRRVTPVSQELRNLANFGLKVLKRKR